MYEVAVAVAVAVASVVSFYLFIWRSRELCMYWCMALDTEQISPFETLLHRQNRNLLHDLGEPDNYFFLYIRGQWF